MRFRKTSREKRETYRQFDETGRCIYEFIPETDEDREMVRKMHAIDDAEVRTNCKEMRLPPELLSEKEMSIIQMIVNMNITGRIPTDKQAKAVMQARERLIKEGMPLQF